MSLKGPPRSFQPENDDNYRKSILRLLTFVRHLKNHSKIAVNNRLANRLDTLEYEKI